MREPVSVIMTVLNEEQHLERAVRSVLDNGHGPGVELVIAVGPSHDATGEVAKALAKDRCVAVVDNPTGLTPQGLNLALAATTRDVIVRIDGHTVLPAGYIAEAVEALAQTGAANVGGQMVPVGTTALQRSVAAAMSSRWGIGGARFHVGGEPGPVDSVFLGTFRRAAVDSVGGFDEKFSRAQDWELNHRLVEAGYVVWFVPGMRVEYSPRASVRAVARQFHASGRWRREVVRTHKGTASVRYLAPPALVAALAVSWAVGIAGVATQTAWLVVAFAAPIAYGAGLAVAAFALLRRTGLVGAWWTPTVLATMHLSWGLGFWRGMR